MSPAHVMGADRVAAHQADRLDDAMAGSARGRCQDHRSSSHADPRCVGASVLYGSDRAIRRSLNRGVHDEPQAEHEVTTAVCVVDWWSGHRSGALLHQALGAARRSVVGPDGISRRPSRADRCEHSRRRRSRDGRGVGLDLLRYRYLSALPPLPLTRRGRPHLGWLHPFVYLCSPELPVLRPQPSEVAWAMWIPISHLADRDHRTSAEIADGTRRLVFRGSPTAAR